jgi:Ca-activated chloride channel family protein
MAGQIPSTEEQSGASLMRFSSAFLFLVLLLVSHSSQARAESLASKNKRGNELYSQGKYSEAEKKYLDAQVNNPGNPSILYNLGNSLIQQKKYTEGMKALNQAIEKGDKTAKENSWYNKGNSLFSAGQFKESAESYIESLKLHPEDKDAKNNLELALQKMQQQEQKSKQPDSQKQDQKKSDQKQQSSPKKDEQQKQENQKQQSAQQNQNEQQKQQTEKEQQPRREGSVSKDKALQILDAVQNQELEEKRKLLERRARSQANGRDW